MQGSSPRETREAAGRRGQVLRGFLGSDCRRKLEGGGARPTESFRREMGAEAPKGLPREVAAEKDTKETPQWRGRTRRDQTGRRGPGRGPALRPHVVALLRSLPTPPHCLL